MYGIVSVVVPAVSCPAELVYNECITCCPVSCNVERMCIDSKLQCLDGCYCPDGMMSLLCNVLLLVGPLAKILLLPLENLEKG